MSDSILKQAYFNIVNDAKLLKLATITSIFHSLIFISLILWQSYIRVKWTDTIKLNKIQDYVQFLFWSDQVLWIFIICIIIFIIWYFLLPPVWEWAIIHYINSEKKWWTDSLGKWFSKFFPMFEFNALMSMFNYIVFIIAVIRVDAMWILSNPIVIVVFCFWVFIILIVNSLMPYAKFLIILDNKSLSEAMWESAKLVFENFPTTMKYILISILLYIRFVFNILLIVWVPALLIYIAIKFEFWLSENIKWVIYLLLLSIILFVSYLNWIIEAFFLSFWNKVFHQIKRKE